MGALVLQMDIERVLSFDYKYACGAPAFDFA